MRCLSKAIAALGFALALAMPQPGAADAIADFNAAQAAKKRGDYETAFRLYEKVIGSGELSTRNLAVVLYNRGNARNDQRQFELAVADYSRAIKLKPDYAKAYYNRGNAHIDLRRYALAIADYTRTIRYQPDHAEAYFNRGLAHERAGRASATRLAMASRNSAWFAAGREAGPSS